ncbi:MAG: hypothetical protein GY926_08785 [bacterium]|nr:hypothetical protein [bacterium]
MIRISALFVLVVCPVLAQEPAVDPADKAALVRSIVHDESGMVMVAEGFVKALDASDGTAYAKLVYTLDEVPEELLQQTRVDAGMPSDEELDRLYREELVRRGADFEQVVKRFRSGWPVLPAKGLSFQSVRSIRMLAESLPEDPYSWNQEQADLGQRVEGLSEKEKDVLIVKMDAKYPGCEPVSFEFDLHVTKVATRWVIDDYEEDLRILAGASTMAFVEKAASAMVLGKQSDLESMLATESDVKWLLGNRAPDNGGDEWTLAELVPNKGTWLERYHLARESLELLGMERASSIVKVDVEVLSPLSPGATEQVSVNVKADYGEAGQRDLWFQIEVMRVNSGCRIPAGGALECRLLPASRVASDPRYKAAKKAGKAMTRPGRKDRSAEIIGQSEVFLGGCDLLRKRDRVKGLLALAGAHMATNGDAGVDGLITAARLYDRANKAQLEVGALAWPQVRRLQDSQVTGPNLHRIISACLQAAGEDDDPAFVADCHEATAIAGSWYYSGGPSEGWTSVAEAARLAAVHFMGTGEVERAFDLLRRFCPVEGEDGMPSASKLSEMTGLPMLMLQDGYQGMGVLLFNQSVGMWKELRDSDHPRPALEIRIRQRLNMAKQALGVANQAAVEGSPYDGFIGSCDQLLEALRTR